MELFYIFSSYVSPKIITTIVNRNRLTLYFIFFLLNCKVKPFFSCLKIIWINDYLLIQKHYFVVSNKEFLHINIKKAMYRLFVCMQIFFISLPPYVCRVLQHTIVKCYWNDWLMNSTPFLRNNDDFSFQYPSSSVIIGLELHHYIST